MVDSVMDTPNDGLEHAVRSSLISLLDKKVIMVLQDGRNLLGWLRTFDQYSNIVMEGCQERIVCKLEDGSFIYSDVPLGLYLLRGENIVLLGELDQTVNQEKYMKRVEPEVAKAEQKKQKAAASELKNQKQGGVHHDFD